MLSAALSLLSLAAAAQKPLVNKDDSVYIRNHYVKL